MTTTSLSRKVQAHVELKCHKVELKLDAIFKTVIYQKMVYWFRSLHYMDYDPKFIQYKHYIKRLYTTRYWQQTSKNALTLPF